MKYVLLITLIYCSAAFSEVDPWYHAYHGDSSSQYDLAVMYLNGSNSYPKDHLEAYVWFKLSANQGHVPSKFKAWQIGRTLSRSEKIRVSGQVLALEAKMAENLRASVAIVERRTEKVRGERMLYVFLILFLIAVAISLLRSRKEIARRDRQNKYAAQVNLEKAKKEALFRAVERERLDAEEKERKEADNKARIVAEHKARIEAEKKAQLEAEEKERIEVEEKRRLEAEEKERLRKISLLKLMKSSLPFYCSVKQKEGSEDIADSNRWSQFMASVNTMSETPTTLYFVKLLSLLDDREYYKIGITTKSVEERFEKSTQIELLEIVDSFKTFNYLARFAEYHFIREFNITPELSESLDIDGPNIKFSGATEVVRPNAIRKISTLFTKLSEYEDKVLKGIDEF